MSGALRAGLPELPPRIRRLPVHRGYPVPWFVQWMDGEQAVDPGVGAPDFRVMDSRKLARALKESRCWVCGEKLGAIRCYVVGPMCAVNRTSAEPPSHRDCAEFSARACPFLSRPHMRRREAGKPAGLAESPGIMLARNPGVTLVWVTRGTLTKRDFNGGLLFDLGEPIETLWFAEGREATRAEVMASIDSGLPALRELAEEEGPLALRELERYMDRAMPLVPA
jgi:hypothetical protein